MDYEKKYKEALERAKALNEGKTTGEFGETVCEYIFPELKESEDDKIRKVLIDYFDDINKADENPLQSHGIHTDKILAWLEKQGQTFAKKDVDDAYLKGISDTKNEIEKQYEANYQIRKDIATFIFNYRGDIKDRAKWMNYLGVKVSIIEKQGEHEDEENADFTIYHPLKNGKGEYECIPYSFYGTLTSFSENSDLINFLRNCFYTEEECEEWIKLQSKQKPIDEEMNKLPQPEYEKGKDTVIEAVINSVIKDKESAIKFLKSTGILNDNGELSKEYVVDKVGSAPAIETPEESLDIDSATYNEIVDECVFGNQISAWSEEDEKIALSIEQVMNCASLLNIVPEKIDKIRTWLKDLKERVQSQQEWCKDDEIALDDTLWYCKQAASIAKDENDMGNVWYAEKWLESLKERMKGE